MSRAGGIAGLLSLLALVVAPTAHAAGTETVETVSTAQTSCHLRVREASVVGPGGHVFSTLTFEFDLDPDTRKIIGALLRTPARYTFEYRRALRHALRLEHFLRRFDVYNIVNTTVGLPKVIIAGRTATIVDRFKDGMDQIYGRRPHLIVDRMRVPAGGRFTVDLDAREDRPVAAWPLPDRDDGEGHLIWEWREGQRAKLGVRFAGPVESYEYSYLKPLDSFAAGALPFVVLTLLFGVGTGTGMRRRRRLAWFGGAVVVLSAAMVVSYLHDETTPPIQGDAVRMLLPALGLAAFVGFCLPRRFSGFMAGAGVFGVALGLAFVVVVQPSLLVDLETLHTEVRSTPELVAGFLLVALLLAACLGASFGWFVRLLPRKQGDDPWWGRQGLGLLALISVAVALTTEIVLSAAAQRDWDNLLLGEPGAAVGLGYFLELAPAVIANLACNLSVAVLPVGLASWFWLRAGDRDKEVGFGSWRECAAFGLLIAVTAVGINGKLNGYVLPVGFIIAFPLYSVALVALRETSLAEALARPELRAHADEFLERTIKLSALRHRHRAVHASGRKGGEPTPDPAVLERERSDLLRVPGLPGKPTEVETEMFTVGMIGTTGPRRRWESLGGLRWLIVAGPMAYATYTVIHHRFDAAVSAAQPAGLAFLGAALLAQLVVWPVAAWSFVLVEPLLPGRIGPFKGVVAGLACVIPAGIASLILDHPSGSESWLFVPMEMTLVFVAIGLALDFKAVGRLERDTIKDITDLYSLTSMRAAVAYLAPLTVLLLGVIHGLATGSGTSGLTQFLLGAESLIPKH